MAQDAEGGKSMIPFSKGDSTLKSTLFEALSPGKNSFNTLKIFLKGPGPADN